MPLFILEARAQARIQAEPLFPIQAEITNRLAVDDSGNLFQRRFETIRRVRRWVARQDQVVQTGKPGAVVVEAQQEGLLRAAQVLFQFFPFFNFLP